VDESPSPPNLDAQLFGLRAVVTGLLIGLVVCTAVIVFSALKLTGPIVPDPVFAYMFLGLAVVFVAAYFFLVPLAFMRPGGSPAEASFGRYATETFVRAGVLDGFGIFLAIGFMMTGNWLLLVPEVVFVVLLAALIPSRAKFEAWGQTG
jgi:hypothetical protein